MQLFICLCFYWCDLCYLNQVFWSNCGRMCLKQVNLTAPLGGDKLPFNDKNSKLITKCLWKMLAEEF
jgi:hypothetical protein